MYIKTILWVLKLYMHSLLFDSCLNVFQFVSVWSCYCRNWRLKGELRVIDAKKAQLEIESAIRVKVNKVMTVVTFPSLIFSTIYTRAHTHGRNSRF